MNTFQERLLQLDRDLLSGNNICSSRGVLNAFPSSLKKLFLMRGLGLIICRQGNFQFALNQRLFRANAGETLFIPEDSHFQVLQESEDMEVFIPIRSSLYGILSVIRLFPCICIHNLFRNLAMCGLLGKKMKS